MVVEGLARTLRLIVGLGMLAAGTMLAAPTALIVAKSWREAPAAPAAPVAFPSPLPAMAGATVPQPAPWAGVSASSLAIWSTSLRVV
ncbi:MAG: hypothetical protein EBX35_12880, partial [Planctomycetia bacterium]|nr:hypothetical protein [Planctomycetia bacterium]